MRMRALRAVNVLVLGWLVLVSVASFGAEPISIEDLYRFEGPSDLVVHPSGTEAVYVRRWADRESRTTRFSLWHVKGDRSQRRALEDGEPDARKPLISPDGKWIVFHSTRSFPDGSPAVEPAPPYSDTATDLWLMPMAGGKPIPLAGPSKPYGRVFSDPFYGTVAFSPDGRRLVFVADDGQDPRTEEERRNNVLIVREDQGEGYEGWGNAQIWVAELKENSDDVAAKNVWRVTRDDVWYGDPRWHPDGRSIIVHANRTRDREAVRYSINKNYDIWQLVLPESLSQLAEKPAEIRQLTQGPGPEVSPRISPDGKQLVCLSVPRKGSHADVFNLMVVPLDTAPEGSRIVHDHHAAEHDEQLPPMFPLPGDCWLGPDIVYYNVAAGLVGGVQVVELSSAKYLGSDPAAHSAEFKRQREARGKLTPSGNEFLAERTIAPSEVVRWRSPDHLELEGVLTVPPEPLEQDARYPLVVFPHGGPHSRSTLGFNFTAQVFAAHGYAVFQPNFRGSAGYGQKFIDADRFDMGGNDMRDILAGIDYLVAIGRVDPERQFLYGVSYGGYTTCRLIGMTHQFRAAAAQNAVTDLHVMWGLSDIQSWTEWEFGGKPWEVAEAMRERSPLTYAPQVRTPTLVLHSMNDRRCPLPMGLMFYRALREAGVDTQMVLYPNEPHGISQLPHQEDVLRRVLEWFRKHDPAHQAPEPRS